MSAKTPVRVLLPAEASVLNNAAVIPTVREHLIEQGLATPSRHDSSRLTPTKLGHACLHMTAVARTAKPKEEVSLEQRRAEIYLFVLAWATTVSNCTSAENGVILTWCPPNGMKIVRLNADTGFVVNSNSVDFSWALEGPSIEEEGAQETYESEFFEVIKQKVIAREIVIEASKGSGRGGGKPSPHIQVRRMLECQQLLQAVV